MSAGAGRRGAGRRQRGVVGQSLAVPFDYPVIFCRDALDPASPFLADAIARRDERRRHRVAAFIDSGLARAWPDLRGRLKRYFDAHSATLELAGPPVRVPGGEACKRGWSTAVRLVETMLRRGLDRQSVALILGGGGVLDAAGFAASLVHRGLRIVRMPTTVLAQADVGVGVKDGLNLGGVKNAVGTFAPPFAVVNDFAFLETLADRDWRGGVAEAFKVAILRDASFFSALLRDSERLIGREARAMERTVRRCAEIHLAHIRESGDAFETGSARPLDFGHWSAHRLEAMSRYRIGHGQAVAIGIALDCYCASRMGLLGERQFEAIAGGLLRCGLPVWSEELDRRGAGGRLEILVGLDLFREHIGGALTLTLPCGIGRATEVGSLAAELIERGIDRLRAMHIKGCRA